MELDKAELISRGERASPLSGSLRAVGPCERRGSERPQVLPANLGRRCSYSVTGLIQGRFYSQHVSLSERGQRAGWRVNSPSSEGREVVRNGKVRFLRFLGFICQLPVVIKASFWGWG